MKFIKWKYAANKVKMTCKVALQLQLAMEAYRMQFNT